MLERNRNRFELRGEDSVGRITSDMIRLRQILLNLLSNACKFTEDGVVSLDIARRDWLITFIVKDTGIGMTEEQLSKLFHAFSQAEASTARKYGGTGLGLAISRRFAQLLRGDITVRSRPGKGTEFTLALPAEAVKPGTMLSKI